MKKHQVTRRTFIVMSGGVVVSSVISPRAAVAESLKRVSVDDSRAKNSSEGVDVFSSGSEERIINDFLDASFSYSHNKEDDRIVTIFDHDLCEKTVVRYEKLTGFLYINESVMGKGNPSLIGTSLTRDWISLGKGSNYVNWAKGTAASIVAAAIAAVIGFAVNNVFVAVGVSALAAIASSTTGCTIYLETFYLHELFSPIQYKYVWGFRTSTGEYYGDYAFLFYG